VNRLLVIMFILAVASYSKIKVYIQSTDWLNEKGNVQFALISDTRVFLNPQHELRFVFKNYYRSRAASPVRRVNAILSGPYPVSQNIEGYFDRCESMTYRVRVPFASVTLEPNTPLYISVDVRDYTERARGGVMSEFGSSFSTTERYNDLIKGQFYLSYETGVYNGSNQLLSQYTESNVMEHFCADSRTAFPLFDPTAYQRYGDTSINIGYLEGLPPSFRYQTNIWISPVNFDQVNRNKTIPAGSYLRYFFRPDPGRSDVNAWAIKEYNYQNGEVTSEIERCNDSVYSIKYIYNRSMTLPSKANIYSSINSDFRVNQTSWPAYNKALDYSYVPVMDWLVNPKISLFDPNGKLISGGGFSVDCKKDQVVPNKVLKPITVFNADYASSYSSTVCFSPVIVNNTYDTMTANVYGRYYYRDVPVNSVQNNWSNNSTNVTSEDNIIIESVDDCGGQRYSAKFRFNRTKIPPQASIPNPITYNDKMMYAMCYTSSTDTDSNHSRFNDYSYPSELVSTEEQSKLYLPSNKGGLSTDRQSELFSQLSEQRPTDRIVLFDYNTKRPIYGKVPYLCPGDLPALDTTTNCNAAGRVLNYTTIPAEMQNQVNVETLERSDSVLEVRYGSLQNHMIIDTIFASSDVRVQASTVRSRACTSSIVIRFKDKPLQDSTFRLDSLKCDSTKSGGKYQKVSIKRKSDSLFVFAALRPSARLQPFVARDAFFIDLDSNLNTGFKVRDGGMTYLGAEYRVQLAAYDPTRNVGKRWKLILHKYQDSNWVFVKQLDTLNSTLAGLARGEQFSNILADSDSIFAGTAVEAKVTLPNLMPSSRVMFIGQHQFGNVLQIQSTSALLKPDTTVCEWFSTCSKLSLATDCEPAWNASTGYSGIDNNGDGNVDGPIVSLNGYRYALKAWWSFNHNPELSPNIWLKGAACGNSVVTSSSSISSSSSTSSSSVSSSATSSSSVVSSSSSTCVLGKCASNPILIASPTTSNSNTLNFTDSIFVKVARPNVSESTNLRVALSPGNSTAFTNMTVHWINATGLRNQLYSGGSGLWHISITGPLNTNSDVISMQGTLLVIKSNGLNKWNLTTQWW
jgi:hypothetical protein